MKQGEFRDRKGTSFLSELFALDNRSRDRVHSKREAPPDRREGGAREAGRPKSAEGRATERSIPMFEFPVRKPADHASLEERTRRWAREEYERRMDEDASDEEDSDEAILDVAAVVRERDDSAVGGG